MPAITQVLVCRPSSFGATSTQCLCACTSGHATIQVQIYDAFREAVDWQRLLGPGQTFSINSRVWSCSNLSSSQVDSFGWQAANVAGSVVAGSSIAGSSRQLFVFAACVVCVCPLRRKSRFCLSSRQTDLKLDSDPPAFRHSWQYRDSPIHACVKRVLCAMPPRLPAAAVSASQGRRV